jgi:glycosyltransferase involved in cell wall biosynthesis
LPSEARLADVLFVHNNFPGQFGQAALALKNRGHRCAAVAGEAAGYVTAVEVAKYRVTRQPAAGIFPPAARTEADIIRGYAALPAALSLKEKGFDPQLIVGHPGWGETRLLRDVFPVARQLIYGEYWAPDGGGEAAFDPSLPPLTLEQRAGLRLANARFAQAYLEADAIVCPTRFQAGLLPAPLQPLITVVHEGVDTDAIRPASAAAFRLPDGRLLSRDTPLITYVSRRFEPLRGFPTLMRALPRILEALPTAEVLLIGSDEGRGYGFRQPPSGTWKAHFLAEMRDRLELGRIHFTGRMAHADMLSALQASSAHVYFTAPYALSWSLLEAMACGCAVVASATAPVEEVIEDGVNGRLADFFDAEGLAERVIDACVRPEAFEPLRAAARRTVVERYDLARVCRPAWIELAERLIAEGDTR